MEDVRIREFLSVDSGSGSGYGDGSGSGYGDGSGDGSGSGYGDGSGDGSGSGYGSGYGDGDGIKAINGKLVYRVDGVPTVIDHIHGNIAKGGILARDLTIKPCYIVKGNNQFAHGETLQEAMAALDAKLFEDMPLEERVRAFVAAHEWGKLYPTSDFFDWHHKLTGSCEMGRRMFAANHGIDLQGSMTVAEFVRLTRNDYGREAIRAVEAAYGMGGEV